MRRIAILGLGVFGGLLASAREASAATAVDTCRTITSPGSYVLTKNLSAAGSCLVVNASRVTIDLAGFKITGNKTGAGVTSATNSAAEPPAFTVTVTNIVVRNGVIDGFLRGIYLADDVTIEDVTVTNCAGDGIAVGQSANLRNNKVVGNARHGIVTGDYAIVERNRAEANGKDGISPRFASTIIGNIANSNGNFGIYIHRGSTAQNNVSTKHVIGAFVECPSNLHGNAFAGNDLKDLSWVEPFPGQPDLCGFNEQPNTIVVKLPMNVSPPASH